MSKRCLYCYLALADSEIDFHPSCSKRIFGTTVPPLMPYSEENLHELAEQIIKSQTTVTGVQPKLSLHLASEEKQQENIFKKMEKALPKWCEFIEWSFLSEEMKAAYVKLLRERFGRLG